LRLKQVCQSRHLATPQFLAKALPGKPYECAPLSAAPLWTRHNCCPCNRALVLFGVLYLLLARPASQAFRSNSELLSLAFHLWRINQVRGWRLYNFTASFLLSPAASFCWYSICIFICCVMRTYTPYSRKWDSGGGDVNVD
jgi:hypothetical protein